MKLVVIGLGQCGGRIADEFARLNKRAQVQRGIDIITGAFAVNTDVADLSGLNRIRPDVQHRILIGGRRTGGHGVGKINELGAEVAREDSDKIIDTVRNAPGFPETDAFLLIAGVGGGTGSGALPVVTKQVKERFIDKPVYALAVLPFQHEEQTEDRTVYNAATSLKSTYMVADAVIVVDNQRYLRKDLSVQGNLSTINSLIAEPFYNILCAGEEKKSRFIGAKVLDAGDIIQTLVGWTVIGYSREKTSLLKSLTDKAADFRKKAAETERGVHVMDQAVSRLSLYCKPREAKRALYLISAPAKDMNMDLIKELGSHLKYLVPEAIIRSGDYPREEGTLEISLILSELSDVAKIRGYFSKTLSLIASIKRRQEGITSDRIDIDVSLRDIPSLL